MSQFKEMGKIYNFSMCPPTWKPNSSGYRLVKDSGRQLGGLEMKIKALPPKPTLALAPLHESTRGTGCQQSLPHLTPPFLPSFLSTPLGMAPARLPLKCLSWEVKQR